MTLTEVEKAYIAGIMDGEGSFVLGKVQATGQYLPSVSVASTDSRLISYLNERCPGSVSSNVNQSYAKPEHKAAHRWSINNKEGISAFIDAVVTYLIIKKEAAIYLQLAVETSLARVGKSHTEEALSQIESCRVKLQELNSKGRKTI